MKSLGSILINAIIASALLISCVSHCFEEKPMVVIIPSYNNERWVEMNLSSVFKQQYSNYRVIYVADCPTDNTVAEVKRIVATYHQEDRFTLIVNDERCGAMANWYTTIHSCEDEEIVIQLDGDDALYNEQVLAYINRVYTERDVWLTYGQFIEYPSNRIGYEYSKQFPESVIASNSFRKVEQLPMSHLRTCKAWLFKAIKLQDTLYQEQFYPMTCDKLMLSCMIEMAARHHYRVPDVLYIYNNSNAICDHRINMQMQHSLAWHILGLPPYPQLAHPLYVEQFDAYDQVTAIVITQEQSAAQAVTSLQQSVSGLHRIIVVTCDAQQAATIECDVPVTLVSYHGSNIAAALKSCLQTIDDRYILLAIGRHAEAQKFDSIEMVRMLKKTQTSIFYGGLRYNADMQSLFAKKLPLINRAHSIAAWYAASKNSNWCIPTLDYTVWHRDLLSDALAIVAVATLEELVVTLDAWLGRKNILGLLFRE